MQSGMWCILDSRFEKKVWLLYRAYVDLPVTFVVVNFVLADKVRAR